MKAVIAITVIGLGLATATEAVRTTRPASNPSAEPTLKEVRAATERFRDVKVALAEGYVRDPGNMCDAAEMMGKLDSIILGQAEYPHRQPPDRAGDAIAIKVESRKIRRPNVLWHVHLHAVDDGEEILALEAELFHRGGIILHAWRRITVI